MSDLTARITFRPLVATDLPTMARWLEQPHMREWWGEPAVELGYIRDMVEGRDRTRPFIFELDGQPIGYIQLWFVDDWKREPLLSGAPWMTVLPDGSIGVDLSIGEPSLLDRGIGSAALRKFTRDLVAQGYRCIVIDPDPTNARAVAAYNKAGFRPVTALAGKTGDTLIMRFALDQTNGDTGAGRP